MIHRRNKKRLEIWHKNRIQEIEMENEYRRLLNEQRELKNKYKRRFKVNTTKLFLFWVFASCTCIEVYVMYITHEAIVMTGVVDLSAIVALIGAIVGQILSFLTYSKKAEKENTKGGITYDMAMKNYENDAKNNECENNDELEIVDIDKEEGACG